jgi:hypothetical protein
VTYDEYLTVSPVGSANGLIPNNGADFGPDTASTTTNGINEALTAASANGIQRVLLLAGEFFITSPINWPSGWSGILEGQGPTSGATGSSETTGTWINIKSTSGSPVAVNYMLTLGGTYPSGGNQAVGIQIRDVKFFPNTNSCGVNDTILDLQQADGETDVILWNVVADASVVANPAPKYCIDMSGNHDTILYNCQALGTPTNQGLKWHTYAGTIRLINGQYASMDLEYQGALLVGVLTGEITINSDSANPLPAQNNLAMFGCFKNADSNPLLLNNSGLTIWVTITGGVYVFGTSPPASVFAEGTSTSQINLSLDSVALYNEGSASMTMFGYTCTTNQLLRATGVNFSGPIAFLGSTSPANAGLGNANQIQVGFEKYFATGGVVLCQATTVDANMDSLVRVDLAVINTSSSTNDTSITVNVTYTDAVIGLQTIAILNAVTVNASKQTSASAVFQVKANTTVKVTFANATLTTTIANATVTRLI